MCCQLIEHTVSYTVWHAATMKVMWLLHATKSICNSNLYIYCEWFIMQAVIDILCLSLVYIRLQSDYNQCATTFSTLRFYNTVCCYSKLKVKLENYEMITALNTICHVLIMDCLLNLTIHVLEYITWYQCNQLN